MEGVLLIVMWFVGLWWCIREGQKRKWNGGKCPCGRGKWKSIGVNKEGALGYTCSSCCHCVWFDWYRPKGELDEKVSHSK